MRDSPPREEGAGLLAPGAKPVGFSMGAGRAAGRGGKAAARRRILSVAALDTPAEAEAEAEAEAAAAMGAPPRPTTANPNPHPHSHPHPNPHP